MKIRQLQLKNIGVFDDETIEFQPCPAKDKAEIHIFTGQNGSGKSTLLITLASAFDSSSSKNSLRKRFKEIKGEKEKEELQNQIRVLFDNGLVCDTKTFSDGNVIQTLEVTKGDFVTIHGSFSNYSHIVFGNSPEGLTFAVFALSGYRRIKDEPIKSGRKIEEHPLTQSLEFIKDENSEYTINQWLGRNLIDSSLAKVRNRLKDARRFDEKIKTLEKIIADIIGYEIKFEMQNSTKLVLVKDNQELDLDVLPDGLLSLVSWIGDLLMRLDSLKWKNDTPIFEREIILFLDEIEVHLHPAWQRKVLPVVQKLFKNSQIFVSTHSPFVVNSIDDAWVYKLEVENGKAKVADVIRSEDGISYQTVLSEIFDIDEEFGGKTQEDLDKFYKIVRNGKKINEKELLNLAKSLAVQSEELNSIIQIELRQLSHRKGKELSI